jgi:hypothetical protein
VHEPLTRACHAVIYLQGLLVSVLLPIKAVQSVKLDAAIQERHTFQLEE